MLCCVVLSSVVDRRACYVAGGAVYWECRCVEMCHELRNNQHVKGEAYVFRNIAISGIL